MITALPALALCRCFYSPEPDIKIKVWCSSDSDCRPDSTCEVTLIGPVCSDNPRVCKTDYECPQDTQCKLRDHNACDPEVKRMTCEPLPTDGGTWGFVPHLLCDAGAS